MQIVKAEGLVMARYQLPALTPSSLACFLPIFPSLPSHTGLLPHLRQASPGCGSSSSCLPCVSLCPRCVLAYPSPFFGSSFDYQLLSKAYLDYPIYYSKLPHLIFNLLTCFFKKIFSRALPAF